MRLVCLECGRPFEEKEALTSHQEQNKHASRIPSSTTVVYSSYATAPSAGAPVESQSRPPKQKPHEVSSGSAVQASSSSSVVVEDSERSSSSEVSEKIRELLGNTLLVPNPKSPEKNGKSSSSTWTCTACTLENPSSNPICEVCEARKPTSESDQWSCQCTYPNPQEAEQCGKCGAPNPAVHMEYKELPISSLAGKHVVLYFSVGSAPPCQRFTQLLTSTYNALKARNTEVEIIFVSFDETRSGFNDNFATMPWPALPYVPLAQGGHVALARRLAIRGVPTVIILTPDGEPVKPNSLQDIVRNPDGTGFPWPTKSPWETLQGATLHDNAKQGYPLASLEGCEVIGLYISAQWCGPCRGFTPKLAETYKKLQESGKQFEVIFVSRDQSQQEFEEYFSHMPWKALYFDDPRRDVLGDLADGIPTLVLLDGKGKLLSKDGRALVQEDPEGKDFPWFPPKPLAGISPSSVEAVNTSRCFMYFPDPADVAADIKRITPIAADFAAKDAGVKFLIAKGHELDGALMKFLGIQGQRPFMIIADVPRKATYKPQQNGVAENDIREFVDQFLSGSLQSIPIKGNDQSDE